MTRPQVFLRFVSSKPQEDDIARKSQTVTQDVVSIEFYCQLWVLIYSQTQMSLKYAKVTI